MEEIRVLNDDSSQNILPRTAGMAMSPACVESKCGSSNEEESNESMAPTAVVVSEKESDVPVLHATVAGCVVSWQDRSIILSSIGAFVAFITYGASMASLGAAVPILASRYARELSNFSSAFALRGGGYLLGTIYSAVTLEGFYGIAWKPSPWYKQNMLFMLSAMTLLTGLVDLSLAASKSFELSLFLFFVHGFSFGGIDTIANVLIPHLWGNRTQPWMQALHMCFGLGALIGPALIGSLGLNTNLIVLACLSLVPLCMSISSKALEGNDLCCRSHDYLPGHSGASTAAHSDAPDGVAAESGLFTEESALPLDTATVAQSVEAPSHSKSSATANVALPLPFVFKALFTCFFFTYVGAEASFGSWVTTYVLQRGVTQDSDQAAFIAAYYWAALTAGRALAIVEAVYFPAYQMMAFQLTLTVLAGVLNNTILSTTLSNANAAAVVYGFALSSIFPLAMTVVSDYNYTMDASSTAAFIVGSCVGDGFLPWLCGTLMGSLGPSALPVITLIAVLICVAIYSFFVVSVKHKCFEPGEVKPH